MSRWIGIFVLLALATVTAVAQAPDSGPATTSPAAQQPAQPSAGDSGSPASTEPTSRVTIPSGTRVLLALKNSLNTRRSKAGDGVYLECVEPVAAGGHMVIPAGTSFQGTLRSVQRPGKLKGRAAMQITIDRMIFRNGYVMDFASALKDADSNDHQAVEGKEGTIRAESTINRDVMLVSAGTLGGAAAGGAAGLIIGAAARGAGTGGPIGVGIGVVIGVTAALLQRGQDVTLDPGTSVEIELQRPLQLDYSKVPKSSPANYVPPQRPQRPQRSDYRYRRPPPMLPLPFPLPR